VLRSDGVAFLNIGDSYAGSWGNYGDRSGGQRGKVAEDYDRRAWEDNKSRPASSHRHEVLKPKDLCLIPFRLAIALQEDDWWVRSIIHWVKTNPMPESVRDRPTDAVEYILMLTKSAKYYWDADAVREPYSPTVRWGGDTYKGAVKQALDGEDAGLDRERSCYPNSGRNIRNAWIMPTQPYPEAHFAVFPEKLPELCIKAATPEVGCCSKCGAPWARVVETHYDKNRPSAGQDKRSRNEDRLSRARGHGGWQGNNLLRRDTTLGWRPSCSCNAERLPSVVLDPFSGAGTTLLVAAKLGRMAVGYDLSEDYCEMAVKRNSQGIVL